MFAASNQSVVAWFSDSAGSSFFRPEHNEEYQHDAMEVAALVRGVGIVTGHHVSRLGQRMSPTALPVWVDVLL